MMMKKIMIAFLFLIILLACKKEKKDAIVEPEKMEESGGVSESVNNNAINGSEKWSEVLKGIHFSHIESGSTLDPNYTKATQAFLCSSGCFYMSVIDNITGSEFEGAWQVEDKNLNQAAVLTVYFSDGDIIYYDLVYYNNNLYIDGTIFQYEYNESECQ